MRAGLYFHTLRYLRPIQIQHQLANRLFPRNGSARGGAAPLVRSGLHALPSLCTAFGAVSEDFQLRFLGVTRSSGSRVEWTAPDMPKLWRYNLHYFDYLLDPALSRAAKERLLDDWIRSNPPGTPVAWDPYPVSLRAVNWIKYFLEVGQADVRAHWLASLHTQVAWLERRLEYHLLANHLLKNAVAMFFAGAFFDGPVAHRWLRLGMRLVDEQIREQFLPDGGHYERSPMYHAICVVDALDVLALARQAALADKVLLDPALHEQVSQALHFLNDICLPDGEIPLFNDAAHGIAPTPASILSHAGRVTGWRGRKADGEPQIIDKSASGYFGVRHGDDMLLIDCGEVGPDYQPGHAHCDTLSYELALNGSRVIVDTGVYDYEPGARRTLSRGTAGHNTVQIDGFEQSEIWDVFRVARRARPIGPVIRPQGRGFVFEGAHDGFRRLPGRPLHRRRVQYDPAGVVEIIDTIEGSGQHTAESRIRLHPEYKSVMSGRYAHVFRRDGRQIARIEFIGVGVPRSQDAKYFPEFGREFPCECIVIRCAGVLPLRFGYRIIKEAGT